jgi:hypothetical protein
MRAGKRRLPPQIRVVFIPPAHLGYTGIGRINFRNSGIATEHTETTKEGKGTLIVANLR